MSDAAQYEDFELTANSLQLRDSGRWTLAVHIRRANVVQRFTSADTFATREEAVTRSIQFGRNIIDGKVPGCSVDELR